MKKFWKALALVGCALLLVVASVAGTYAILTSTASVSNTFTAGNVSISLKETKVDEYGNAGDPPVMSAEGNTYKLIPNHTYTKDPTIYVASGSEQCYLFVKVENGISDIEADTNTIVAQLEANGWKTLTGVANVWYYDADKNDGVDVDTPVDAREAVVPVVVFESFTIKNVTEFTNDNVSAKINVTAYAAQADGFTSAAAAWTAASFS